MNTTQNIPAEVLDYKVTHRVEENSVSVRDGAVSFSAVVSANGRGRRIEWNSENPTPAEKLGFGAANLAVEQKMNRVAEYLLSRSASSEAADEIRLGIEETVGGGFLLRFESGSFALASSVLRDRIRNRRYSTIEKARAAKEAFERGE